MNIVTISGACVSTNYTYCDSDTILRVHVIQYFLLIDLCLNFIKIGDCEVTDTDFAQLVILLASEGMQQLYILLGFSPEAIEEERGRVFAASLGLWAKSVLQWWKDKRGADASRRAILDASMKCDVKEKKLHVETLRGKWGLKSKKHVVNKIKFLR